MSKNSWHKDKALNMNAKFQKNFPLIFVSNHQSTYDVSPIIWNLREFHPKFVSKKKNWEKGFLVFHII